MTAMRTMPPQSYFKNKRVIIRVDWNVDIEKGHVLDDGGIRKTIRTIRYVTKNARSVLVISHLGHPKPNDTKPTLAPVAGYAAKLLGQQVYFLRGSLPEIQENLRAVPSRGIALMENIRLYRGEYANDAKLSEQLARLGDVYIDDAFGEAHRAVASIVGLAKLLPHFAGFLMQDELVHLDALKRTPQYPFVVVLGGAKLETKLPLVEKFLKQADAVLLGGGIANTFLAAGGVKIGASLCEKEFVRSAQKLLKSDALYVPIDFCIAQSVRSKSAGIAAGNVGAKDRILDIGPQTAELYSEIVKRAQVVFWNGPMGYFENPIFAKGTNAIAAALKKNKTAHTVIGGGDTIAFLKSLHTTYNIQHTKNIFISTGGGAMLYYLAGKKLPGIAALEKGEPRLRREVLKK